MEGGLGETMKIWKKSGSGFTFVRSCFRVSFSKFVGASGGVPGGLLEHFFVNKHKFTDFVNTFKIMTGAVFQQV